MAFPEFVAILFLTQLAGYGAGFMTLKINNLLVIAQRFGEADIIMNKMVEATYATGYSLDGEKFELIL